LIALVVAATSVLTAGGGTGAKAMVRHDHGRQSLALQYGCRLVALFGRYRLHAPHRMGRRLRSIINTRRWDREYQRGREEGRWGVYGDLLY